MPNSGLNKKQIIAIMLDVQGTLDGMNEKNASLFMDQLDILIRKFLVDKAIISISSHVYTTEPIKKYADIIKKVLRPGIELGKCYYMSGIYNPNSDETIEKGFGYNIDKTFRFSEEYLSRNSKFETCFFAVVDDMVSKNIINQYVNMVPMILSRPSQKSDKYLQEDSFMCYNTNKEGFDGVVETFNQYLLNIKNLNRDEIFEQQRKICSMESSSHSLDLSQNGR